MDIKLTPAMERALIYTEPGDLMKGGPTRAALMRRGLVYRMSRHAGMAGTLTPDGVQLRGELIKKQNKEIEMLMPSREEIETLGSAELRDLLEMVESVISERLDAPEAPNPREGYFTEGCGREVAQRDAEAVAQDAAKRGQPAGVKLYRTLEVLEYMSATLLVIDGAMYRIGCMGGDVEDRRPLMLLPVSMARAPWWSNNVDRLDDDALVRLKVGGRIKINGTVYEVVGVDSWELKLIAIR